MSARGRILPHVAGMRGSIPSRLWPSWVPGEVPYGTRQLASRRAGGYAIPFSEVDEAPSYPYETGPAGWTVPPAPAAGTYVFTGTVGGETRAPAMTVDFDTYEIHPDQGTASLLALGSVLDQHVARAGGPNATYGSGQDWQIRSRGNPAWAQADANAFGAPIPADAVTRPNAPQWIISPYPNAPTGNAMLIRAGADRVAPVPAQVPALVYLQAASVNPYDMSAGGFCRPYTYAGGVWSDGLVDPDGDWNIDATTGGFLVACTYDPATGKVLTTTPVPQCTRFTCGLRASGTLYSGGDLRYGFAALHWPTGVRSIQLGCSDNDAGAGEVQGVVVWRPAAPGWHLTGRLGGGVNKTGLWTPVEDYAVGTSAPERYGYYGEYWGGSQWYRGWIKALHGDPSAAIAGMGGGGWNLLAMASSGGGSTDWRWRPATLGGTLPTPGQAVILAGGVLVDGELDVFLPLDFDMFPEAASLPFAVPVHLGGALRGGTY